MLLLLALVGSTALGSLPAAAAEGWRWPVDGPRSVVRPFAPGPTRYSAGHYGADLAAPLGTVVRAAGAGRVTYAGLLAGRGVVVVDHGTVRTTYEPVASTVHLGAQVSVGQPLGHLTAGHACAPSCLHLGLLRGDDHLDPLALFRGPVRLLPAAGTGLSARGRRGSASGAAGGTAGSTDDATPAAGRADTGLISGTGRLAPGMTDSSTGASSGQGTRSAFAASPAAASGGTATTLLLGRSGAPRRGAEAAVAVVALVGGLVLLRRPGPVPPGPAAPAAGAGPAEPPALAPDRAGATVVGLEQWRAQRDEATSDRRAPDRDTGA